MGLKPKNFIRRLFHNKTHYHYRHIVNTVKISTHDQSVQTSFNDTQLTTTVIVNSRRSRKHSSTTLSSTTPKTRRRSSLKTYISIYSPKIVPLINRSIHRRRSYDFDLKMPKRLKCENSNVALIRKIRPITTECELYEKPLSLVSIETKKLDNDTTLVPNHRKLYHDSWEFLCDTHSSTNKYSNNNMSFLNSKEEQEQVDETISMQNQNEHFSVGTIGPLTWSTPIHTASFKASSPYSQNPYREMNLSFSNIFNITCLD